jgi:hypothetical protein
VVFIHPLPQAPRLGILVADWLPAVGGILEGEVRMKFCNTHWEKLRQAIKGHGIWDLVATSGEEAISQMTDNLKGVPETLERYDPLMATHNMIWGKAMEFGGLYLLGRNPDDPDGHYCPLCG